MGAVAVWDSAVSVSDPAFLVPFALAVCAISAALWFLRERAFSGVPEITANTLGLFRVVVGAYLAYLVLLPNRDIGSGDSGYGLWRPWGFVTALADKPEIYPWLELLALGALALFIIGLWTRVAHAGVFVSFAVLLSIAQEHGESHRSAPLLLMLFGLLFVRWGDGLSVDDLLRRLRGGATSQAASRSYGLGIWLPGATLGLLWLAGAYAKLDVSGIEWVTGGSVRYHFAEDAPFAPTGLGSWIAAHGEAAVAASAFAFLVEALFITHVLFRDWRVRMLYGSLALSLFVGFYVFQGVHWPPWWLPLLALLIPWPLIDRALGRLPRYIVLIDGSCALCQRTARILHALDFWDRLSFHDARDERARARWAPGIDAASALRDMHVIPVTGGPVRKGFSAYAAIGRALPPLLPLAILERVPLLRGLGERAYRRVANRREHSKHTCRDAECTVPPEPRAGDGGKLPIPANPMPKREIGVAACALVAFLAAQQLVMSGRGVEQLPFLTNVPMYADTFVSEAEFNSRRYARFSRLEFASASGSGGDAQSTELAQRLDRLGVDAIILDSKSTELIAGAEAAASDLQKQLAEARTSYANEFGEAPPRVVRVIVSWGYFDFDSGRVTRSRPVTGELDLGAGRVSVPFPDDVRAAST